MKKIQTLLGLSGVAAAILPYFQYIIYCKSNLGLYDFVYPIFSFTNSLCY